GDRRSNYSVYGHKARERSVGPFLSMIQFTFFPETRWLVAGSMIIAVLLFVSYFWARRRSNRWLRLGLVGLRWSAIAAVLLCWFDPQWIEPIKHQQKSRVAVLLDTSRSMSIKDVPPGRLAEGRNWLQKKFAPQVPDNVVVQYYAFNQALESLASLDTARPEGTATALADSLEALLNLSGEDPLTGVVLVSDGIESARRDPVAAARLFRRK